MNKIYRVTLIFLLLILLLANVVFFMTGGQILSYFKVETELEAPRDIILNARNSAQTENSNQNFFDLSIIESDKFNKLKDFEIDLSSVTLPDNLSPGGQASTSSTTDFEVGNPDPFTPSF